MDFVDKVFWFFLIPGCGPGVAGPRVAAAAEHAGPAAHLRASRDAGAPADGR